MSIRRRLVGGLLAGGLLVLLLAGTVLHAVMSEALVTAFDETLHTKARNLGVLLEVTGPGHIELDEVAVMLPEYDPGDEAEYYQLFFDAERCFRSPSLAGHDLPLRGGPQGAPRSWNLELPDGRTGRALGVRVVVPASDEMEDPPQELPEVTVVVARSRESLDSLLASLLTGLFLAGGASLVLMLWGVRLAVGRALAPIDRLGGEVAGVDAASLSRRVGTRGVPDELLPLVAKTNELLGRLEAAFGRQQRMTAAMAHELRTPIAELRTVADVARRWPDDEPLARGVVATASDVAVRMTEAVEAVMRYCRMESGQAEPELEAIPLRSFLAELWTPHEAVARERGVELDNRLPADLRTVSDGGLLAIVVGNLLGNAAGFSDPGSVRAAAVVDGRSMTLEIANATDRLGPEDIEHLSEPFWRKDVSRSDRRHSGLGLTLVQSVGAVLGHPTRFALEQGEFVVRIELPLANDSPRMAGDGSQPRSARRASA